MTCIYFCKIMRTLIRFSDSKKFDEMPIYAVALVGYITNTNQLEPASSRGYTKASRTKNKKKVQLLYPQKNIIILIEVLYYIVLLHIAIYQENAGIYA